MDIKDWGTRTKNFVSMQTIWGIEQQDHLIGFSVCLDICSTISNPITKLRTLQPENG